MVFIGLSGLSGFSDMRSQWYHIAFVVAYKKLDKQAISGTILRYAVHRAKNMLIGL